MKMRIKLVLKRVFAHRKETVFQKRLDTSYWYAWVLCLFLFASIFMYYTQTGAFMRYQIYGPFLRKMTIGFAIIVAVALLLEWEIATKRSRKIGGIVLLVFFYSAIICTFGIEAFDGFWSVIGWISILIFIYTIMSIEKDSDGLWNMLVYIFNEMEDDERKIKELELKEIERLEKKLAEIEEREKLLAEVDDLPSEEEILRFHNELKKNFALFCKAKKFGSGYNRNLAKKIGNIASRATIAENTAIHYIKGYKKMCVDLLITYIVIAYQEYDEFDSFDFKKGALFLREYESKGLIEHSEINEKLNEAEWMLTGT